MSEADIELDGRSEQLGEVTAFLHDFWRAEGLPEAAAFPFELSLEELFMNVAMHGTADPGSPPRVRVCLRRDGDRVELNFRDRGTPFDPLTLPSPDLSDDLDARTVGGLGVFLVREMMDEVEYRREDGWNSLRVARRISPAEAPTTPTDGSE